MGLSLGCSGQVPSHTGIGVIQQKLYPFLESRGHELSHSRNRDLGPGIIPRGQGMYQGLRRAPGTHDAYLSLTPPFPFAVQAPTVGVVHDLRWTRTRGPVSRAYREWDLRRTVRKSARVVCVSDRTKHDLAGFVPEAGRKALTVWPGPGHMPHDSFVESNSGTLLLVGGARHKRNEDAARLLATSKPTWISGIVGIGVSDETRKILDAAFENCQWLYSISDNEVVEQFVTAEFFMLLSQDEGFGLPYIEALAAGCTVIAVDQVLTRELLGSEALLLDPARCDTWSTDLQHPPALPATARKERAARYSWTAFGAAIEEQLISVASHGEVAG